LALPATTRLLGGRSGLEEPVQWVHRMASQAPAFSDLGVGEIVLISVVSMQQLDDRLTLARTLKPLAGRGVVAAAVVGSVSERAVSMANALGLVLFGLPGDTDLRDIERDVARLIVEREAQLDRRGRQVYRQLAAFSLENRGLPAIAEALLQILGKSVVIQDEGMAVQALALTEACPYAPAELQAMLSCRTALHQWLLNQTLDSKAPPVADLALDDDQWGRCVAAVVIEGKLGGYLSVLGPREDLDDLDRLAAERGALVCAVELAKQRAVEAAENRLRSDFLDVLLTAGAAEGRALSRRALEMGYDLDKEHVVVLFGLGEHPSRVLSLLASEFRSCLLNTGVRAFLSPHEGDLAALCSADDPFLLHHIPEHVHAARKRIAQLAPDVRIGVGIGRPGEGLAGLRRSFVQAQESLSLARDLFDGERILSFGDLGLYHLLCQLRSCEELLGFYEQTLSPLVAYDAGHDTELVPTLEAFFAHHGNVSQTAGSLFLHRNSLLYRLERICEITEMDLDDADDRFSLQLALKLQPFLAPACPPA
jgi:purine catabolism regulator